LHCGIAKSNNKLENGDKMTKTVSFTKMHGTGNDYIYVNTMEYALENPEELARQWSVPHTGIGADGLVLIGKSVNADFKMRIFNADGSEAMMCGNASRCIGKYVYDKGLTDKTTITLETLSGVKVLKLKVENKEVTEVTVDMGKPIYKDIYLDLNINGHIFKGTEISMGNPHFVTFVDDIDSIDLPVIGSLIENHFHFPDRTNVEFVQVLSPDELRMRVWERGSGITMACGTGACATLVAASLTGYSGRSAKVIMDGGPLTIDWDKVSGSVFMTGGAVKVFEGTLTI